MTLPKIKYYWSFDEGSGDQAIDAVQGARMTIQDPATWVRGVPKSALHLHPWSQPIYDEGLPPNLNPPDYIITTGSPDQPSKGDDPSAISDREPPWTAAVWVKREDGGKDGGALFSSNFFIFRLEQYEDRPARNIEITICSNKDMAGGYRAPDAWVHLVFVGTREDVKLYANGELKHTFTDYATDAHPKRSIDLPLRWIGSVQAYREGGTFSLDELKIFRGALTAAQVTDLYKNQFPRTGAELLELSSYLRLSDRSEKLALEYYWRFDAGNTLEAIDAVKGVKRVQAIDAIQGAKITIAQAHDTRAAEVWIAGRPKNALRFEPAAARIVTTSIPDQPPPWTAAMWVKREGKAPGGATLLSAKCSGIKLEQWENRGTIGITNFEEIDIDEPIESAPYTSPLGVWEHLVFVATDQNTKAYVNGKLKATFGSTIKLPLHWIGCTHGYVEYGAFSLDELKIYHEALTAEQALELYQQVAPIG